MTVKHDSEGNGTVRLSTRDWIWLITLITGAAIGVLARMDYVERRMDVRFEIMRSEWTREAPSPAMWTKDSIARHDREMTEIRERITQLERKQ